MLAIVLYLAGTVWLMVNAWLLKKSEKKLEPFMMLYLLIFFLMGEQALFALVFHFVHIPIGLVSIGIANILLGSVIYYFKRKVGHQEYERIRVLNLLAFAFVTVLSIGACIYMWGWHLNMYFLSIDGLNVHCMLSETIAKTGAYENPQYFEALNGALMMQIVRVFVSGDEGYHKAHMISQILIFWMSGLGFYTLCQTYRKKDREDIWAGVLTFFYLAGYPLLTIYFGFSYFGTIVNMVAGIFVMYRMMHEEQVAKWFSYVMLNLMLYSMFACYSFFIPFVFPPLFVALWFDEVKREGRILSLKMIRKEFQVFLLPCVIGMINSFSNLSQLGDGGGITNNGGCYIDVYSNFLYILPLTVAGVVVALKKNKHDILFLELVWSLICLYLMIIFNSKGKISLYYVSKIYNILWLVCFVFMFIAFCEFREKTPSVLVGLVVFVAASFLISKSSIPGLISKSNPEIYNPIHADYHALYPDVYWYNQNVIQVIHNSTVAAEKELANAQ